MWPVFAQGLSILKRIGSPNPSAPGTDSALGYFKKLDDKGIVKSVQRGASYGASAGTEVTISPVNTAKSFAIVNGQFGYKMAAELTNSTTLTVYGRNDAYTFWQVVEYY